MSSSATEAGAENKMGGKPLKGGALYAALNDAYVEPVRPAGQANARNWPGEIFQSDGYYVRVSNGTRRYGGYQIHDDGTVCVEGDEIERSCRYLIANADGTYSFVGLSGKPSTGVTIKPRQEVNNWLVDGEAPVYIDYEGQRYIKLSGAAIFPTLFDHELSYAPGSLLSRRYFTEVFMRGMGYIMSVQEPPFIHGTWSVVNDSVCVKEVGNSEALCRQVYLNSDRTQVLLVERSGDRRHYALAPSGR